MTLLTVEQTSAWVGRLAQDPYGEPLGEIVAHLLDRESGTPEWLLVDDGHGREAALVPIHEAVETGDRIRVTATAAQVHDGPRLQVGREPELAEEQAAAAHYGLAIDTEVSPSGQLREPSRTGPRAEAEGPGASAPSAAQRRALIGALRRAHAMEQGSLKRLAAMRWRVQDEELIHDLARHHKETNRHAEMIRERLETLGATRDRPLDWKAKMAAYARAQVGRLRSYPDPADARAARALEEREMAVYDRLQQTALAAGDRETAALAAEIRADEQAMACTIAGGRMWADPGQRADRPSPFEPPSQLQEGSPRS